MKTPDPAGDTPRRTSSRPAEPGPRRSEEREDDDEFRPQYLSLPQRRSRGHGFRNLLWGVALLFLSALLLGWGLYLAGPGAAYTVAVSLATAAALYVIARSRLLRQRNGNFLAGAIVCLLAAGLVLVQQAWLGAVNARPAPGTVAAAEKKPEPAPATSASSIPALIEIYKPSPAELESGQLAVIVRPLQAPFNGKTYQLRPGEIWPVGGLGNGQVRLAVGMDTLPIPLDAVKLMMADSEPPRENSSRPPIEIPELDKEPLAPTPADAAGEAAKLTQEAQKEAIRRYPALGVKDSPENQSFVESYKDLKHGGGRSFLEDPEWPLRLAEILATREGWMDSDGKRKQPKATPLPDEPEPPAPDPAKPMREPIADEPPEREPLPREPTPREPAPREPTPREIAEP